MSQSQPDADFVGRRAELLAELFLTELGATVLQMPPSKQSRIDIDYLALFQNSDGSTAIVGVEVKGAEKLQGRHFSLRHRWIEQAKSWNIPVVLLVIDVKENRVYYAFVDDLDEKCSNGKTASIEVNVLNAGENKERLLKRVFQGTRA